jgi:predicted ester cyclase
MSPASMSKAQMREGVQGLFETYNKGTMIDEIEKWYTADIVNHFADGTEAKGLTQFKQMMAANNAAFPDLRVTLDDIVIDGNKEAHRYTWSGTFKGKYGNMAPTGKKITVAENVCFQRWEGGKIAEIWWISNDPSMLRQMGVIPAPAK